MHKVYWWELVRIGADAFDDWWIGDWWIDKGGEVEWDGGDGNVKNGDGVNDGVSCK